MIPKRCNIKNWTRKNLRGWFKKNETSSCSIKSYRADQVYNWLYQKKAESFDQMLNLGQECRKMLEDNFFIIDHNYLGNKRKDKLFQGFVIGVIIFSALVVGTSTFQLDPVKAKVLNVIDYCITVFFVMEITIRFIGEPVKRSFFKDGWNLFDTIIVTISLIPLGAGNSALLLRLLRIFRVLRLITFIPELRGLIESLLKSLPRIGYVCLLLFIILYIYAAFGSILFGEADPSRWQDIGIALITLVQVITLSSWEQVMLPLQEIYWWTWIYFYTFIALGAVTLLNMIIAVLVDAVSENRENSE